MDRISVDYVVWYKWHVRQFRRHRMLQDVVDSSSFLVGSIHLNRSQPPAVTPCRPAGEAFVSNNRSTAPSAVATSFVLPAELSSTALAHWHSITPGHGTKSSMICRLQPVTIHRSSQSQWDDIIPHNTIRRAPFYA